ncbi:hypothetical protein N7490_002261 [Penicillium lividum]|nr:hypothetical protein N7490_002261 [Penicillium lividum]
MSYQVECATEQDAVELGRINYDSFQHRLVLPAMFPEADEPSLRTYKSIHAMKHLSTPETHVVKVTDNGVVVGYGRWYIPEILGVTPNVPELSEQGQIYAKDPVAFAPQPMNTKAYTGFKGALEKGRKEHTTERDMMLDLLATLPSYQGRGIGSAMLRWGITQADALQARIYLEATPEGYPLYVKYGWKEVGEIEFDFDQLGYHGKENLILMMRDPIPQRN